MNWKKLEAIIFDLDDTLYPEREYVKSGFRAVSEFLGNRFNCDSDNILSELDRMFLNGYRGDLFDRLLGHYSDWDVSINKLIEVYRNHIPKLKPFDGLEELLQLLKRNKKLALISDGYLDVQVKKFESLKLKKYFNSIIFPDQWGKEFWKPSTKPFRETLQQMKVNSGKTVYVADNPIKDFKGAKQLGIHTIRIRIENCEHTNKEAVSTEYAPDKTVYSLKELRELLTYD